MTPNSELNWELKYPPKKGVILYLKFLLHFWSYNNSLEITLQGDPNKLLSLGRS